jgi:hypothetical protein
MHVLPRGTSPSLGVRALHDTTCLPRTRLTTLHTTRARHTWGTPFCRVERAHMRRHQASAVPSAGHGRPHQQSSGPSTPSSWLRRAGVRPPIKGSLSLPSRTPHLSHLLGIYRLLWRRRRRARSCAPFPSRPTTLSSTPGLIEARAPTHWLAPPLLSAEFGPRRPPSHCLATGARRHTHDPNSGCNLSPGELTRLPDLFPGRPRHWLAGIWPEPPPAMARGHTGW